jgi:hypothetical protein
MCAPGDQRKSSGNQREQAEPNALECQRRADVSRGCDRIGEAELCPEFNSRNERLWSDRFWRTFGKAPTSPKCQFQTHEPQHVASYSITSSARSRNDSGTIRPITFAALRLMAIWNLVGSWTGRSLGLVPLRIRSI